MDAGYVCVCVYMHVCTRGEAGELTCISETERFTSDPSF